MADGQDRLAHLLIVGRVEAEEYRPGGGGSSKRRTVNRAAHGQARRGEVIGAFDAGDLARDEIDEDELRATGSIIVVEGADAINPLKLESLDRARGEWLLLSSHTTETGVEHLVVWVSDAYRARFLQLFDDYLNVDTQTGKPKNEALVANIARIRASLLRDLWQSDGEPPEGGVRWWEIWLRREPGAADVLRRFAEVSGIEVAANHMELDQRIVLWVNSSWEALTVLPATAVPIAEIRRGQFIDTVDDLPKEDQFELVTDLADRIEAADPDAPAVCLLDTGCRRTHALIAGSLDPTDWHSVTGDGAGDVKGHGTLMAGLALLGPIDGPLLGSGPVSLLHRLESVKLLPDHGPAHDPTTYGLVTAQAVATPEATHQRRRVLCMPVTAPHERSTEPSLWSASVDALAAGTDIGAADDGIELIGPPNPAAARLFLISTGNTVVPLAPADYLDECDASVVEDPAQAWNALVVGASTGLTETPTDPSYQGWTAIARAGELSPHSRTGLLIPPKWPIRPDICMEGGNVLTNGYDTDDHHALVSLATTGHRDDLAITTANATSAATAQASRLAARAMAVYPDYWPETIRGLVVHSAEWTPTMLAHVNSANSVPAKRAALGRYGWGVPDESAALSSARNAVTMVVQDRFVPFTGSDFQMRQFRLHRLPWPTDVLADLGAADVRLKVTLSYFIEPSAPRRGWRNRYAYASHGLRFELKNTTESVADFVKRVNRGASHEEDGEEPSTTSSGVDRWLIGPKTRNVGSLHQDIWTGSGADLAQCDTIAVHPVGGWWKNGKRKDRRELPVRYALIVSLATQATGIDIYEPIATQLAIDVNAVAIAI